MLRILKTKKNIFFMLLILMGQAVCAEPIVIRDYGGRDSGVPTKESMMQLAREMPAKPQAFDDTARYPIRSSLRPGYLDQPQKLRNPVKGVQPFFIISNDEFSRDWLEKNKHYLVKIGAQGLATNINNKSIFLELEKLAKPLPLVALPVDEIAQILTIEVYPVLVTGEEIAQ